MNVGVFDLIERGDVPTADLYEQHLELAERYDRAGFFSYHLAEHHATPHGLAPSPSVFLSAVAQRTRRLRFGPMVFLLPFYHPLRVIEEVCMLDQLSRGRVDVGFGRGISPLERAIYQIPPADAEQLSLETYAILRAGLSSETLTFAGRYHRFDDVPLEVRPYQRPYPPLWYGTSSLQSVDWVAAEGVNLVTSQSPPIATQQAERYWEVRDAIPVASRPAVRPRVGLLRKVVVAPTDSEAHALAVRAYPRWIEYFNFHMTRAGQVRNSGERPPSWDEFEGGGRGVAGSPATVAAVLNDHLHGAVFNYLVVEFSFGRQSHEEVLRSVDLFSREVMPALRVDQRREVSA